MSYPGLRETGIGVPVIFQEVVHSTGIGEADCAEQSTSWRGRMDIHKNARLTLRSREALVQEMMRGMTLKRAAARFNVTAKTIAKWVSRYRIEGPAGLLDRSSRPRHSPRRTPCSLATAVLELRRQHRPAYQIAQTTAGQDMSFGRPVGAAGEVEPPERPVAARPVRGHEIHSAWSDRWNQWLGQAEPHCPPVRARWIKI